MKKTLLAGWILWSFAAFAGAAEIVQLSAAAQARAGLIFRPVTPRAFGDQIRILGQAVRSPGATSTVKSVLEGRVIQLFVAPGQAVRQGQPLLEMHSHMLHELQGQLLRHAEAVKLAESSVEAGRQLLEIEGISQVALKQREQIALGARLELRHAEAELHDLGYSHEEIEELKDLGDVHPILTVKAPAKGVVLQMPVEQHEWVRSFEPLVVLGNPESLELELELPPASAEGVAPGDLVEFVPVGRPEDWGLAKVVTQVPQVDAVTRTVTLRAQITHGQEKLIPGVFVEGNLIRGAAMTAPSVPESAIIRIGASDYVFVRLDAESFEARPVTVGRFNGSRYEITAGVEADEEVAVQGVFLLKSELVRGESEE